LKENRMSEHPCRETLESFLLDSLPAGEVKATVTHLLGGCDRCRSEMSALAVAMFNPETAPEPRLSAAEEASYDRAIAAAFDTALVHEQALRLGREAGERRAEELFQARSHSVATALPEGEVTWGLCEALIEKSRALRHTDAAGMLYLANLARLAADRLDPAACGAERRTDMQARAWAELANAYRLNDELAQAEAAMACALDLRVKGTGDPLLYARIVDLNASLLCDQRRFKEAFRMLDLAYAIHRRHSGSHEVGRVLILKGLYTAYSGKPEEGLQLLVRGLTKVDRARDAYLTFQALHNILLLRVELGDYEDARRQLQRMRPLYSAHASWLDVMKLHRIEGDIAAGLGDLVTAEATFQQIRQEFDDAGRGYLAALTSLDLAKVWLRQGRTAEVRGLVAEALSTFQALGVEREALSALHMLQDALEREQAVMEILRLTGGILRRLQNEPAMRAGLDSL
jgi:tetratricopeptide (TPR) repeat protein